MKAHPISRKCLERLAYSDIRTVAKVAECEATDLAIAISPARLAVVRCVESATSGDHTALATMIAEKDFVWGAIVLQDDSAAPSAGEIETFHVDELEPLVARILELREAWGEPG